MLDGLTIGIIGGTGQLGHAILTGLLKAGAVTADQLWVSNRQGARTGLPDPVTVTSDTDALCAASNVILLSIPPRNAAGLKLETRGKLVISVMAGVTLDRLSEMAGHARVIRAMSSPAAEHQLAYSPFCSGPAASQDDLDIAFQLFDAIGKTDQLQDETQLDVFTAITGPVPGFVALFADAMIGYARGQGVADDVVERAIRQLFLASGKMLGEAGSSPAEQVEAMIDYAGTTAEGLKAMKDAGIAELIEKGLAAATDKARKIADEG